MNKVLLEYKKCCDEMLRDCRGETQAFYGWIDFDLVERMADEIERLEQRLKYLEKRKTSIVAGHS